MTGKIQHIPVEAVFNALNTRPEGLSSREIIERRDQIGANSLEVDRGFWWLDSLIRQFTNFFTILLDISAAICFFAHYIQPGEQMDILGYALLGVSILNALFSFFQEYRAERAMEELKKFLPSRVLTIRDGQEAEVPADSLVPGDVIIVREGDRVPADARLCEARDLTVSNAPLTGESASIQLVADPAPDEHALIDSRNLLFAGCSVVRGYGLAVVFATGYRSQFGRIAMLSREIRRSISPLERETGRMVRILTIIAVTMGLVFFAYGVVTGRSLWTNLVFMMGIIVANVPEGLLPTFTLSLAMGSLRMAKRNVLVKSLNAVEALGSVHVICTDKTGTLTRNQLTLATLAHPISDANEDMEWRERLLCASIVASDLDETEAGLSGDPLDVAVANYLKQETHDGLEKFRELNNSIICRFPFDVAKRRAGGIIETGDDYRFCVKGAWESLQPRIRHMVSVDGDIQDITPDMIDHAERVIATLASHGQRVIAVAERTINSQAETLTPQDKLESDLTLVGFLGLEDPMRPEVPDAVAKCHTAGIEVVMITGDHPETAEAIARQAGIIPRDTPPGNMIITGTELDVLSEPELIDRTAHGVAVFARTTPEQKMKIVNAFEARGKIVAVTGDGVNDAPALKAATVGIAMGRDGTDVAREAAQVILLDDNFASIVDGIEEGRTIYANIRKFTNYVLVSNGPEIIPYLLYMLFPVPLALTVVQILSIDLCTDIIPSMALGQEKPDSITMRQPPRDRGQSLMNLPLILHSYGFLGLIEAAFSLSLFFWVLYSGGWVWGVELASGDPLYRSATGIALASIILMQIGNLFGRRSRFDLGIDATAFQNPLIIVGITIEIVLSWVILYVPSINGILGTAPVEANVYLTAWLGVPLIFGLDYVRKRIARRFMTKS